ncbi:MAG: hypothetical protein OEY89_11375 [Gammaproteobacteria bacterium]|nr:hypothetical protein [Gammaproteobacteria bacterium]
MTEIMMAHAKSVCFFAFLGMMFIASGAYAEYGDIIMNKKAEAMRKANVDDVVFPHWFHRIRYRCNVCHENIFKLDAGSNDITMKNITEEEKMCGACHNGVIAWSALECERCHTLEPGWTSGPVQLAKKINESDILMHRKGVYAEPYEKFIRIGSGWHPVALSETGLPLDRYGLVNWASAVREGIVDPLWTIDPDKNDQKPNTRTTRILFETRSKSLSDVIFPHDVHSYWLQCDTCHNTKGGPIFKDEAGSNPVSMMGMRKGKWCARCHNNVSFPIADCGRCHLSKKNAMVDKDVILRHKSKPAVSVQTKKGKE